VLDRSKAIWLGQNTAWDLILLTMELLGVLNKSPTHPTYTLTMPTIMRIAYRR